MPNRKRRTRFTPRQKIQASECCLAVTNPTRTGDERRNYILHLFSASRSSPRRSRSTLRPNTCNHANSETYKGKNTEEGGSDPTLCGFQPPKIRGVAPACPERLGAVFCPPRREKQEFCQTPEY